MPAETIAGVKGETRCESNPGTRRRGADGRAYRNQTRRHLPRPESKWSGQAPS